MTNYIPKPWGYEQILKEPSILAGETIKNLVILAGESISLQYHRIRKETWVVKSGRCLITIGEDIILAFPGTEWLILPRQKHRVEAITSTVINEISVGFDANDIVRLEDKYGRTEK